MDKRYVIFDTATNSVVGTWFGNSVVDPEIAKSVAGKLNADRKPEYQTLTVATLIFDTEI